MNKVVILLFLLAAGISLQAQTFARSSSLDLPISVDRGPDSYRVSTVDSHVSPLYRQTYAAPLHINKFRIPGEKKKKVGTTMTVLGSALIVGGIVTYAAGDPNYSSTTYNQTTGTWDTNTLDPKRALGILMIVAGTGVAVPGILIWTKGIREYNQYMREQEQSLNLGIGPNGTVLYYRF